MLLFNIILSLLLQVTSIVSAADTSAWKSRSIYFVLTDRIARSSGDTGGSSCSNLGNYCGGTASTISNPVSVDCADLAMAFSSKASNPS